MGTLGFRRFAALIRKESLQIIRDPSSILIAVVLPLILLFLFGYGISLDATRVKIGLALESESAPAAELAAAFRMACHLGWNDRLVNHITARVPGQPDLFLMNPHGLGWHEITASCLVKADFKGNIVSDTDATLAPSISPTSLALNPSTSRSSSTSRCSGSSASIARDSTARTSLP